MIRFDDIARLYAAEHDWVAQHRPDLLDRIPAPCPTPSVGLWGLGVLYREGLYGAIHNDHDMGVRNRDNRSGPLSEIIEFRENASTTRLSVRTVVRLQTLVGGRLRSRDIPILFTRYWRGGDLDMSAWDPISWVPEEVANTPTLQAVLPIGAPEGVLMINGEPHISACLRGGDLIPIEATHVWREGWSPIRWRREHESEVQADIVLSGGEVVLIPMVLEDRVVVGGGWRLSERTPAPTFGCRLRWDCLDGRWRTADTSESVSPLPGVLYAVRQAPHPERPLPPEWWAHHHRDYFETVRHLCREGRVEVAYLPAEQFERRVFRNLMASGPALAVPFPEYLDHEPQSAPVDPQPLAPARSLSFTEVIDEWVNGLYGINTHGPAPAPEPAPEPTPPIPEAEAVGEVAEGVVWLLVPRLEGGVITTEQRECSAEHWWCGQDFTRITGDLDSGDQWFDPSRREWRECTNTPRGEVRPGMLYRRQHYQPYGRVAEERNRELLRAEAEWFRRHAVAYAAAFRLCCAPDHVDDPWADEVLSVFGAWYPAGSCSRYEYLSMEGQIRKGWVGPRDATPYANTIWLDHRNQEVRYLWRQPELDQHPDFVSLPTHDSGTVAWMRREEDLLTLHNGVQIPRWAKDPLRNEGILDRYYNDRGNMVWYLVGDEPCVTLGHGVAQLPPELRGFLPRDAQWMSRLTVINIPTGTRSLWVPLYRHADCVERIKQRAHMTQIHGYHSQQDRTPDEVVQVWGEEDPSDWRSRFSIGFEVEKNCLTFPDGSSARGRGDNVPRTPLFAYWETDSSCGVEGVTHAYRLNAGSLFRRHVMASLPHLDSPSDRRDGRFFLCGGHITLRGPGVSIHSLRPYMGLMYALYRHRLNRHYCSADKALENGTESHYCVVRNRGGTAGVELRLVSRVAHHKNLLVRFRLMEKIAQALHQQTPFNRYLESNRRLLNSVMGRSKTNRVFRLARLFHRYLMDGVIAPEIQRYI